MRRILVDTVRVQKSLKRGAFNAYDTRDNNQNYEQASRASRLGVKQSRKTERV